MGKLVLITGGVRSGKSSWALAEANKLSSDNKIFIATALPFDDEMRLRIDNHQKERGKEWQTVEAPENLAEVITIVDPEAIIVVDCCTVWLGNIWHRYSADVNEMGNATDELLNALRSWQERSRGVLFVISNEVGLGIVPHDAGIRLYRDTIGLLNQRIARIADEVYLCVSGIAVPVKNQIRGV
ncbi:MAG: bifunctional adenosylcobinamide kinase/adenosylcobinamide-phosphate guanylyltransferase [Fibrobacter sp.]|nr:bifunctional adenosylcobinamide kinase/adenosylcobinamide-phosphate guanylyltransferase [Fibrobacter sp.]